MNLKERIICSKIARLDPDKDATQIGKLKARLAAPAPLVEAVPEMKNDDARAELRRPLTEKDVEDFRLLNAEVHIRSKEHGDIWLVPERTGSARFEILPEEIRMLSLAGDAFDAKVVEVKRNVPS